MQHQVSLLEQVMDAAPTRIPVSLSDIQALEASSGIHPNFLPKFLREWAIAIFGHRHNHKD